MTNREVIEVLEDMKVMISIPKAAELQRKRNNALDMAIEALKKQLIRCKDCIYYSNGECNSAEMWQNLCGETSEIDYISRYPNDFCSYAERRTDE